MKTRFRETVVEVHLPNLYYNYQTIQKIIGNKTIIPVVKADAYGHGAIEVVGYLREKGIDYFAVSLLEEALELRKIYSDIHILCMGIVENDGLLIASENDITVTMSNFNQLENYPKLSKKLKVHLNVDTGMNRLGFRNHDDIKKALRILDHNSDFYVEGIYSHFSTADENISYYEFQLERFSEILRMLRYPFKMVHISNSSAQLKFEKNLNYTTHTRLGISLYGLTSENHGDLLKNTFFLKTKISQLNYLQAGERLGYGAAYTATKPEIIAVLPLGYADGFIRKNTGGDVEINGKRFPIIGRICMDQMFIRIDDTVSKSDVVTLFGGLISIDEVAKRLDTINYEIICDITKRVPREYIK